MSDLHVLDLVIFVPVLGAVLVAFLPKDQTSA